jgi:hypothetical protein
MHKKKRPTADPAVASAPTAPIESKPRGGSKQALLCDLMRSEAGASLQELTSATNWQPHTVRAALTGLRKRGLEVAKEKVDGLTRYRLASGT